ncbi:hypothetical protein ACGFX4_18685 [Kitasatospora sp. NPDC048365]|uniref:hypothetical protein n=1 Tax=Kitasatospora sp. NPDC048365 TaxID=3364050 RepID=UPI003721C444
MRQDERHAAQEAALDALLAALGLEHHEQPDERVARLDAQAPGYARHHRIGHKRQTAYRALEADRALTARHADLVVQALAADDDPTSPSWLTRALLAAIGHRRTMEALLTLLEHGTPHQRTCAAAAWHWARPPAHHATAVADLDTRFREAVTREAE